MKMRVDIDEAVLVQARQILNTTTNDDTVNAALLAVVDLQRRREALREEVANPDLYRRAVDDEVCHWP